jgi:hypothetical protein
MTRSLPGPRGPLQQAKRTRQKAGSKGFGMDLNYVYRQLDLLVRVLVLVVSNHANEREIQPKHHGYKHVQPPDFLLPFNLLSIMEIPMI